MEVDPEPPVGVRAEPAADPGLWLLAARQDEDAAVVPACLKKEFAAWSQQKAQIEFVSPGQTV